MLVVSKAMSEETGTVLDLPSSSTSACASSTMPARSG